MRIKPAAILLIFISTFYSCQNKTGIEGLWIVNAVKVGNDTLTPNAKWTRFNADSTQQSGNGWFQHTIGTWRLDSETNKLYIINSNGIEDPYEPFSIRIENNLMYWNRIEDGQNVEIVLEKSDDLPKSYGDSLLGLWKLKNAVGDGKYFKQSGQENPIRYLYFRWDKRFVIGSENGRVNGVYNAHGHKPEVELIPYGKEVARDFWAFKTDGNSLSLTLVNSDILVTREFIRVNKFPE